MAALYPLARKLASRQLGADSGASMQPTDLVGSAYLRLRQSDAAAALSQAHFISLLCRVLRQVVVDHWRHRGRQKRAATPIDQTLSALTDGAPSQTSLVQLDELIGRLEQIDRLAAEVVWLRVFGGLTGEEVAEQMQIGTATVTRKWRMASAWLKQELQS